MAIDIALVGFGKISVDQHVPAIRANASFNLVGTVSEGPPPADIPCFPNLAALLARQHIDAVAINTPPQPRYGLAREALQAGLDVLVEKPPTLTPSQLDDLSELARATGSVLYTAWHSQHAAGVDAARAWLADQRIRSVTMRWLEDVRQWHPGQAWIWEPGGFGVFDPAINGLSILSQILPVRLLITKARLDFPTNCQAPVRAHLDGFAASASFTAALDFLHPGRPEWSIEVSTDEGLLALTQGGAVLTIAGQRRNIEPTEEYASIYREFAERVAQRRSKIDPEPLRLVADAFLLAERNAAEPFIE